MKISNQKIKKYKTKNNICIIINENKVYNNEEEKNDENEIIDSDENKLKNKNIIQHNIGNGCSYNKKGRMLGITHAS